MRAESPKRTHRFEELHGGGFAARSDATEHLSALTLAICERTFKLCREANDQTFAANLQALATTGGSAEVLLTQWSLLVADHQRRLLQSTRIWLDIAWQAQLACLLWLREPAMSDAGQIAAPGRPSGRAADERRVSAKLIQFPDRRVAR
jgi:hypothetical protein